MLPLGDDDSRHTLTPWVNYLLIAVNVFVFVVLQQMGNNQTFTLEYALVPAEIMTGNDVVFDEIGVTPVPVYFTLITSVFLHGSLMHLGGNMLYLWIFGDNLENRIGHKWFLIFYLLCGVVASLSHIFYTELADKQQYVPSLGASGAIAGIMGGYLSLYPHNKIRIFIFFIGVIKIPAFVALGVWILFQLFNGYQLLFSDAGGVAYMAHIGGFILGLLTVRLFPIKNPRYLE